MKLSILLNTHEYATIPFDPYLDARTTCLNVTFEMPSELSRAEVLHRLGVWLAVIDLQYTPIAPGSGISELEAAIINKTNRKSVLEMVTNASRSIREFSPEVPIDFKYGVTTSGKPILTIEIKEMVN